jgi:hypothetical protein
VIVYVYSNVPKDRPAPIKGLESGGGCIMIVGGMMVSTPSSEMAKEILTIGVSTAKGKTVRRKAMGRDCISRPAGSNLPPWPRPAPEARGVEAI